MPKDGLTDHELLMEVREDVGWIKNHLSSEEWMFARIGEPKAVEIMIEHNIEDVKILEELHDVLAPYRRWIRNSL